MAEAYKSNEKGLCIRGGRGKAVVISSRARGSRNGRGGGRTKTLMMKAMKKTMNTTTISFNRKVGRL